MVSIDFTSRDSSFLSFFWGAEHFSLMFDVTECLISRVLNINADLSFLQRKNNVVVVMVVLITPMIN